MLTARLLGFGIETFLECALFLQRYQALRVSLRVAFWSIVFGKDAVAFRVEDYEGIDTVQREVRHGGSGPTSVDGNVQL